MHEAHADQNEQGAILTVLTTDDVHDYVDCQATPEIETAIETLIEEDPRVARWVSAYRYQNAAMHRTFNAVREAVPARFRRMLKDAKVLQNISKYH